METPDRKPFVDRRDSLISSLAVRLPPSSLPHTNTQTPPGPHTKRVHCDATHTKSVHYHVDDLKAIGRVCGNRLPPASSVQAMFLYEMQRGSEQERLFHSAMFELACTKDASDAQTARMTTLEHQISTLQKQVRSNDTDYRLATSKVRMDAQQAKINEQSLRINDFDKYLQDVQQRVEDLKTESSLYNSLVNGHTTTIKTHGYSLEDVEAKFEKLMTADQTRESQVASFSGQFQQLQQNDQAAMEMFKIQHGNIQSAHESIQGVKDSFESSGVKNLKDVQFTNANAKVRASVGEIESSLKDLNSHVAGLHLELEFLKDKHGIVARGVAETKATCAAIQATNSTFDENIGVLFDERDALIASMNAACTRIEKLEGTVRALTGQATSPVTFTAGNSLHMLPVRGPSGKAFDLAVPKGSSLIEYRKANHGNKENTSSSGTVGGDGDGDSVDVKAVSPVPPRTGPRTGMFSYFDEV